MTGLGAGRAPWDEVMRVKAGAEQRRSSLGYNTSGGSLCGGQHK